MASLDNLEGFSSEELLYLARLAEQAERYEEMIKFVSAFVKRESRDLSVEERNILSVAYKNVIGSRRSAWRILSSIEQKEERKGNADHKAKTEAYKREIEQELNDLSAEILGLIRNDLFPRATNGEAKVFYSKMEGDYYRYICEYASGGQRDENAQKALGSYQEAYDISTAELSPAHPIRLGLALNFSVFHYEIM
jgi:14-3-3 protein epsilon